MEIRISPLTFLRCLSVSLFPCFLSGIFCSVATADDEASTSPIVVETRAWSDIATATVGVGVDEDGEGQSGAEFLAPVFWDGRSLMFLYPDLQVREGGERDLSIGFGFRHLVGDKLILGTNAFYDNTESGYGHNVGQFGIGAEVLMQRFRARGNYYKPEGARTKIDEETVERQFETTRVKGNTSPVVGPAEATGYGIYRDVTLNYQLEHIRRTESYLFERFEQGMEGYEVEAGFLTPGVDQFGDLWLYGGFYQYDNPFGGTVEGPMARAEAQLTDHLIFDAAFFEDQGISGTGGNWTFGLRASFPLGGKYQDDNRPRGILNGIGRALAGKDPRPMTPLPSQIGQNIIRNNRVRLVESDFIENVEKREVTIEKEVERIYEKDRIRIAALLAGVGAPGLLDLIFVDINAAPGGNGTFERPFQTITEAQMLADSRFASLGRTQGIYVQTRMGAYVDNVTFNQMGGRFALVDSSITLPLQGGGTFGGGTTAANWTPTMGSALVVDGVSQFAFGGFNITTNGADPGVQISNVNGPVLPPPPGVIDTEAFHFIGGTSIASTGGPALEINDSAVSGSVMSLASTNSANSGVSLTNMSGSLTVTGDVTVTGSTDDGIVIDTVPGDFSVEGLTTLTSGMPVNGIDGIDIQDSSGDFVFATVDIDGWEDGVDLEDNTGTISILGGTIDGSLENGIEIVNSSLIASNLNIGSNSAIANDGIAFDGDAGMTSSSFTNITITDADDEGIQVETYGGSHQFSFNNITILDSGETGIVLDGFGGGLLTVTEFSDINIVDANTDGAIDEGGIFIDTVTFDADPTTMAIEQVNGGNITIGTMGNRVDGFGLVMFDPSGDLGIDNLNIFNDGDTGLYVNTKFGSTTFNLDVAGGSIDTINGSAMYLDPLSGDINLTSVRSVDAFNTDGSFLFDRFGIYIEDYAGLLNIGTAYVENSLGGGFVLLRSSADVTVGNLTVDTVDDVFGNDAIGVLVADNTGSFTVTGTTNVANSDFAGVIVSNADADFQGLVTVNNSDDFGIIAEGTGTKMFGGAQIDGADTGILVSDSGPFGFGDGPGSVTFGDVSVTNVVDYGVDVFDYSGIAQFGTVNVGTMGMAGSGGDYGVSVEALTGGSVTFGALNIQETNLFGFYGADNAGMVTAIGSTVIDGVGGVGIGIEGTSTGSYAFNSVSINLGNDNTTGLSLNGATLNGNLTAADFDLTADSSVGTTGIDLSGATGTGTVTLGETGAPFNDDSGATINGTMGNPGGPAVGVQFDGTTDIDFVFGDGEEGVDIGSTINAGTAIAGTLPPVGQGTYNFLDVNFPNGTGIVSANLFFATIGAGQGLMDGSSFANAGSLADAEISMSDAVIVFDNIENGMQDFIDFGADTFDLNDGQVLASISQGQTLDLSAYGIMGTAPGANFQFNMSTPVGSGSSIVTAPGAGNNVDTVDPIITSSALAVVELNDISGTLVNVNVEATGASGNAIRYIGSGTGNSLVLDNVVASSSQGIAINIDPTTTGLTITGSGNTATGTGTARGLRIAEGTIGAAGLNFSSITTTGSAGGGAAISINEVNGPGAITIDNVNLVATGSTNGLEIDRSTANVIVTGGTISNTGTGATVQIGDGTDSGGGNDITIGANIDSSGATGLGVEIFNRTGGTLTFSGNLIDDGAAGGGVLITGTNSGVIDFTGAANMIQTVNADGVSISGSGTADFGFSNFAITTTVNSGSHNGFELSGSHAAGSSLTLTNVSSTVDVTGGNGIGINLDPSGAAAPIEITGSGIEAHGLNSGRALRLAGGTVGASGLTFSNVTTAGTTGSAAVSISDMIGAGDITLSSVNILSSGSSDGLEIYDTTADVIVTGGTIATNGSGSAVQIGDGVNSGGGNDITIGANINSSGATGLGVEIFNRTGGTLTFSGNLIDDGAAGGGVLITGSNSGVIDFTGASNMIQTVNADGVSISGSGTADFGFSNFTITTTVNSGSHNGFELSGSHAAGSSLTLTNVSSTADVTGGNGIGINLDPSGAAAPIEITGSGIEAHGLNNGRALRLAGGTVGASGLTFSNVTTAGTTGSAAVSISDMIGAGDITLSSVNILSSGSSDGLEIYDTTADVIVTGGTIANNGSGSTVQIGDGVNSGGGNDITIGANINSSGATGLGVEIFNRTGGTLTFSGNLIDDGAAGGGVLITGANSGVIDFTGASNMIQTVNADGVSISGSGTADFGFSNFTITTTVNSGSHNGFELSGSHAAGSSLTLTNVSSTVNVTGGNGIGINLDPAGAAAPIEITGSGIEAHGLNNGRALRLAGGTVGASGLTFTSVTSTGTNGSPAVSISDMIGAGVVELQGVNIVSVGTADGLIVTNNTASFEVTGAGNTVTTAQGTAVNISNTPIGPDGVTFQSISADGGTTAGIILDTTGTGSFTVTGDGMTAGSGGTIQNRTGGGDGADGIFLNNVDNVSLSFMNITNNNRNGIFGSNVFGFQLNGVVIDDNTDQASPNEAGLYLQELTGDATHLTSITNTTVSDSTENNVIIENTMGTLTNLDVTGSTFQFNTNSGLLGNNFLFVGSGSAVMNLNFGAAGIGNGNVVDGLKTGADSSTVVSASGLKTDIAGTGSMDINVVNNTFTDNNVGIDMSTGPGSATFTFDVLDNGTITFNRAIGINLFTNAGHTGTVSGTIQGNTVGTAGQSGSGALFGSGIRVANEGSSTTTVLIDDNTVQEVANFEGIRIADTVNAGTVNATITSNTLHNIIFDRAIEVSLTSGGTINTSISGNSFTGTQGGPSLMRVRQASGTFNVEQETPTAAINADELDDANGITAADITVTGTINFNSPAPPTP